MYKVQKVAFTIGKLSNTLPVQLKKNQRKTDNTYCVADTGEAQVLQNKVLFISLA